MIIACFVISDDAKALLGIKGLKVWACSLGLLCLTLLFHTWSRDHFQENFVIPLVLKVLPPAGFPSSGISVTFLSSGPGVFRLGSGLGLMEFLEDTKECVCLFWLCVWLFQCCFSFTLSLPAHSWVLYFITSTVVSAGGFGVHQVFCCWWDSQKDLCGIHCWDPQFPSAGERMFEPWAKKFTLLLCFDLFLMKC